MYLATLFLSFHYFITIYVGSSLLSNYASKSTVSLLYALGSVLTIFALVFFSPLLRRFGNAHVAFFLTIVQFLAVLGLSLAKTPGLVLIAFILFQAIPPLILFSLDIFLENIPHLQSKTGGLRGMMLTVMNAALVLSPLIIGLTAFDGNFSETFLVADLFLLPVLIVVLIPLRSFADPTYGRFRLKHLKIVLFGNKNVRNAFISNFLLQIFYTWMVVYTPLYLQSLGFSWQDISLIFTFMLLPFLLFELPVGRLADMRFGEKEFMVSGFVILSLSTGAIAFLSVPSLPLWALLLFLTRTGASLVEITTESYFFKHTQGRDIALIGTFRMTKPLSFIVGPLLGVLILLYVPLPSAFFVFALVLSSGIVFSLSLKDTK